MFKIKKAKQDSLLYIKGLDGLHLFKPQPPKLPVKSQVESGKPQSRKKDK